MGSFPHYKLLCVFGQLWRRRRLADIVHLRIGHISSIAGPHLQSGELDRIDRRDVRPDAARVLVLIR